MKIDESKQYKDSQTRPLNFFYVYIIECNNHDYYVGKSNQLTERVLDHKIGHGAERIKLNGGFKALVYFEKQLNEEEAIKREKEIQNKGKPYQIMLVREFQKNLLLTK